MKVDGRNGLWHFSASLNGDKILLTSIYICKIPVNKLASYSENCMKDGMEAKILKAIVAYHATDRLGGKGICILLQMMENTSKHLSLFGYLFHYKFEFISHVDIYI